MPTSPKLATIAWRDESHDTDAGFEHDGSYFCTACQCDLIYPLQEAWDAYQAGYDEKPINHCPECGILIQSEPPAPAMIQTPASNYLQPEYNNRFCYWNTDNFQHFEHLLVCFSVYTYDLETNQATTGEFETDDFAYALQYYNETQLEPNQGKHLDLSLWVPIDEDENKARQHRVCFLTQCLLEKLN